MTTSTFGQERIVAIDLRLQTLGFVVLEGAERVLDWGVKGLPGGPNTERNRLSPKMDELLAAYVPDAIVLRRRIGVDAMLSELEATTKARRVILHFLTRRTVKSVFPGRRNKDQIASAVCDSFPELLPLLPPKRKIWRHEDHRMRIFDAAANGIAYFAEKQKLTAVPIPPI
jgi:hypothetical protein